MKKLYFFFFSLLISGLSFGQTTDLLISKYAEGSANNKFLEIYNGTGSDVDLSNYSLSSCSNGCDTFGEFDFPDNVTFAPGTILADGDVYVIAHPSADPIILAQADTTFTFLSNGDDAFALTLAGATASTYTIIDILGDLQGDPGTGWAVGDDPNGTQDQTLTRKTSICSPNPTPLGSFGVDAASSEWIVGPQNSGWAELGSYTGCLTAPTITITSPTDFAVLAAGTTSVDVEFIVENAPGATVNISYSVNGGSSVDSFGVSSPFQVTPLVDGDAVTLTAELVDGGVLDFETIDFSIAFPCDLQVGTITETCDAINPGPGDTYNVTIDYTGGGTTTYGIDTQGIGTLGGDNPTSVAAGTITITNIPEDTDFVVTFTGDPMNSGCDFTRNINSPDCDPLLTLPINETFTYADGSLVGNSEWQSTSGNPGDFLVSSGQAICEHGTPSEDVALPFAAVTGDVFYAFDMSVADLGAPYVGGDNEYFAHFRTGSGFVAQLDIVEPTAGGDYTLGIATDASTAQAIWATDLSFDTTYRVVVRYDQDLSIAELWVDATLQSDTSILGTDEADPGEGLLSFAMRQSDSSENETITIDNLVIAEDFNQTTLSTPSLTANEFSVYPNPAADGFVNIVSTNNEDINVTVFDILGKEVLSTSLTNNRLNVSSLTTGLYMLRITQNNASVTKKLVIR
ncbi:T9SS type A sorting domain-containing protein [Psychroserpens sp.]|uniref:T9SS type A sorting domain-containing protein n=1 Tax=Psychroserpens sp. TaxID=2020870 RepID=UPI001B1D4041|nr:T9SS type A sorting domain-containing protein [Psychroserpens sp.]MBO6605656.1 T9SS type A sorting domain-containing protein [Psychroserpens sp.]MBO6631078.1 T9SS type A sorting domain-containing protein [Psychroserpens sp.]MBO6652973.1 T9SS type A sorting domain-containing protein [Psychroserpens sp.]MBO6681255.1 T9SS type A sorting domain-containing protein [Psychroserpens sp.]MBO6749030.1 T9SS type A sorting domain-containing protein [Psychroserpens sp.]